MQLSLEGDAHLLGRLAQGTLVDIDASGMEGVDVNWCTPSTGLKSRRNYSIDILIIKCTGAIRGKFSLPADRKNRVAPVLNYTVTPFHFPCTYARYRLRLCGKEDRS